MSVLARLPASPGTRALVVAGLLATAASCSESSDIIAMGPSITLTPPSATISVGDSVAFRATTANPPNYRWTTSDPAVAVVSAAGIVRAVAPGQSTITVAWVEHANVVASALVVVRLP